MKKQKLEEKEILGKMIDGSTPTIQGDEDITESYKEIKVRQFYGVWPEIADALFPTIVLTMMCLVFICFFVLYALCGDIKNCVLLFFVVAFFGAFDCFHIRELIRGIRFAINVRFSGKSIKGMIIECDQKEIGNYSMLVRTSNGYRYFDFYINEKIGLLNVGKIVDFTVFNDTVFINLHGSENEKNNNQYVLCKEASLDLETFISFCLGFGFVAPLLLLVSTFLFKRQIDLPELAWIIWLFIIVFAIMGIRLLYIAFGNIIRYILFAVRGRKVTGLIRDYERQEWSTRGINGVNIIYMIQIDTSHGQRLIRYNTNKSETLYDKDDLVELKVYGDYYKIIEKE
jgi:hypothetical protein